MTKLEADYRALDESDPLQRLVNDPASNMFATGEPDDSNVVPVFCRRSFVDDICFGGKSFDECLAMLNRLLVRFTECRISISFTKSIFVQPQVDFLSHKVTAQGIAADPTKLVRLAEWPFPVSKKDMQAFLGVINYYSRFIQNIAVYGAIMYQLKEDDLLSEANLAGARAFFAMLQKQIAKTPVLCHFVFTADVHVMFFANGWA